MRYLFRARHYHLGRGLWYLVEIEEGRYPLFEEKVIFQRYVAGHHELNRIGLIMDYGRGHPPRRYASVMHLPNEVWMGDGKPNDWPREVA